MDEGSAPWMRGPRPGSLQILSRFSMYSQKIDSFFSNTFYQHQHQHEQICPAPSALILSMLPHANPFTAPLTPVPRAHAAPAIRHSSAAMTSPYPSACSATLNSLILRYSISVSPSPSCKATSQSTNKTFYSPKNKPCSLPHKLPSPMTASSRTLTTKLRTSPRKSNNS
jgi:hypothetical protein